MAAKKKQVTPKQAAGAVEGKGRGVMCRTCYVRMGIQLRIDGGQDYLCAKCGRIWPIPKGEIT